MQIADPEVTVTTFETRGEPAIPLPMTNEIFEPIARGRVRSPFGGRDFLHDLVYVHAARR